MFIISYITESGDKGCLGVFTEYPTAKNLSDLVRQELPHEICNDEGEPDGSENDYHCVHFDIYNEVLSEYPYQYDDLPTISGI